MKSLYLLPLLLILQACCGPRAGRNPAEATSLQVETLLLSTQSWDGDLLPPYPEGQPEITLLKITIPPGASLPLHSHPVINVGKMLSGELIVTTEKNDSITLKAGDSLIEVVQTLHYGRNPGTVPAEILVFYAGVVDTPITVLAEDN